MSQTEPATSIGPAAVPRTRFGAAGRFVRGFVRQSVYFTLYLACLLGLVALAFQNPKVKEAFKNRVAHVKEKYLGGGAAPPPAPVSGDVQARLDGMEATLQSSLTEIRVALSHANAGGGPAGPGGALPGRPAD